MQKATIRIAFGCLAASALSVASGAANAQVPDEAAIMMCDLYAQVATAVYTDKLSGISYVTELQDPPAFVKSWLGIFTVQPVKEKGFQDAFRAITRMAYTSSWGTSVSFSEKMRSICLYGK